MRRLTRTSQIALLLLTSALLLGAGDNAARFDSIGHNIMCVCGCNYVLLECNHVGCPYSDGMRKELATAVDQGNSESAILQQFVQKYGPAVLLAPSKTGFGRIAWVTPYLALFLGVGAVVLIVRGWKSRPLTAAASLGESQASQGGLDSYRDQVRKDTEQI